MKVYIKAVQIADLKKQYPDIQDRLFKELINLDPTADYDTDKRGKYGPWILKQYKLGNLTRNDFDNVKDALEMFARDYRLYPKSDLNTYATVAEFLQDTHAVGNRELSEKEQAKLLKKHAHNAGDADKEFLVEDDTFEVWKPLTYAGSISLARSGGVKASWCTAYEGNDRYWESYTKDGPLYIFLNKHDPSEKYQLHIPSNSWYDIHDYSLGMDAFDDEFCIEHPIIADYFDVRHENGVKTRAGVITGYDKDATEIILPEGVTRIPNYAIPKSCTRYVVPDSVTSIASGAFARSNIEELVFNHLDTIDAGAFQGSAIKDIDFTKIDTIGSSAFRNCQNLTTLNLNPNGKFGSYAFGDNKNITGTVTVYPTMKVTMGLFNGCSNLTVDWRAGDIPEGRLFDIDDIKLLIVNKEACPRLVSLNEGYIPIQDRR